MKVPISKPWLGREEAQLASEAILSGWVTQGPKVAEFEKRFTDYTGAKHAIAVSNCTTALHLSMIVAGVKQGDEVICPSMSYIATANSIKYVGAIPVFGEVDENFNLDISSARALISPKTKAILLVHQIGMPADIDGFSKLCQEHNLVLIEDAACAIGSSYSGKKIGSHSDLVCFSFHPRKVITTGDGGMITTSRQDYADRLRLLRQHGMSINDRVRHESQQVIIEEYLEVGYNYRMTDIQAGVGIYQMQRLNEIVSERRKIASRYNQAFQSIKGLILPRDNEKTITNFQSYALIMDEVQLGVSRNEFMQRMLDRGVATRRGIMTAHREKAYEGCDYTSLEKTEFYSDNSVLLPIFVPMNDDEIQYVINTVIEVLG